MTTKHSLMGALLLAAALPATALAQAGVSTDRKSSSADTLDVALIATLEKAHAEEIAAGRSALTSTQNDDVKKFAQKMVDDHTKALDKLNRIKGNVGGGDIARANPGADMRPAPGARDSMLRDREGRDSMKAPSIRDSSLPSPSAGMGAIGDSLAPGAGAPLNDRQFIDAMVVGHQQLLGKLPEEGRGVQNKELRSYVADVRKDVQRHFTMARELQTKMGGRQR